MALSGDELRRRIVSAAALHGWGLRELRDQLEAYGANKHMAEGMIAGKVPQNRANMDALGAVLDVPVDWFEAEDWRPLLRTSAQAEAESPVTQLDLAAMKAELLADLATGLETRDAQHRRPERGDSAEGLPGG